MPNRFLLTMVKGVFQVVRHFDTREEPFHLHAIKNILLINTTALGDTLLATPAIRAIRKGFPNARITVLASRAAQSALQFNPRIDEIIVHPGRVNFWYFLRLPRLIRSLRKRRFDLSVILHANDPDAAPLAYISGAVHRMGWMESRLAFLHTIPVQTRVPGMHGIDIHLKNVVSLGIQESDRTMEIYFSEEEKKNTEVLLQNLGLQGKSFIGVHPFGSKRNKWWPAENVIEFCKRVVSELGMSIAIFGGAKESQAADDIRRQANGTINVAGMLSIRESVSLMRRCTVFISTDSGPMHIAQALGVPTIALFGPDDPRVTGPISQPYVILRKDIPCSPCRLKTCDANLECMREISPDDVFHAMGRLLSREKDDALCTS